jgi:membrane dipeptidase
VTDVSPRARRVFDDAVVIDAHNDLPTKILDDAYDAALRHHPGFAPHEGETDVPRLVESGIAGQFLTAFVDAKYAGRSPDESFARAVAAIDAIHGLVAAHPDALVFSTTAEEIESAKRNGRVAVCIGVEGGHAIESSIDKLRDLYRRGARYMGLTWNNGNDWAGSSVGLDGTRTGGLTALGVEIVREMNRLGMFVDVSHVSDATFDDVLATSVAPVIASHSSARAIDPAPRNLADDQIRAVARSGGVVNVNFYAPFVDASFFAEKTRIEQMVADEVAPERREGRAKELVRRIPLPPLAVLIDHIDHVARVAGIDHVGLGSDFDGVSGLLPVGMNEVTRLPWLVDPLFARGYGDDDVKKILGGNMLRVMRRVLDR